MFPQQKFIVKEGFIADKVSRHYGFTYDGIGRLVSAAYSEPSGRQSGNAISGAASYATAYTYGLDSRPLTVRRLGVSAFVPSGTSTILRFGVIDNLTFTYTGSQLTKVSDAAADVVYSGASDFNDGANSATEYTYDPDGRLLSDANKDITSIKYNALGLPSEITFGDGSSVTNLYSASGALLQRIKAEPFKLAVQSALPAAVVMPNLSKTTENHIGALTIQNSVVTRIDTPNGYFGAGKMHYYVKDYQGNVRQVTDADGNVEQDNHYYPYGMLMAESSDILAGAGSSSANPYLFGAKEYLTTAGANLLDFTARTYDPSLPLFQTQDPMAWDYTPFLPYLYCASDPVNRIDPDGRIVYIVGTDAEEARSQLQSKVGASITLKLNDEGLLTYEINDSSKKLKGNAKKIAAIIDNETIIVDLNTTNTEIKTPDGYYFVGGAFLGNIVKKIEDKTVTVEAGQLVNTKVLKEIDELTGEPGASIFHELTEAYQGALISQKSGKNSPRFGVKGTVYDTAHRRASPAPADVNVEYYDKNMNVLPVYNGEVPQNTFYTEWFIVDRNGKRVVIQSATK